MKFRNKSNQILDLLNKNLNLSIEIKLEQMKLDDGVTVVEAESFEPEYSIGIVTENGIIPMPVGEYTTQDGKKITVAVEGVIATVTEAEAEEPETETETPEAVVEPEMEQQAQPKRVVESVSKETFFAAQTEWENEKKALTEKIEALEVQLSAQTKVELAEETPAPLVFNPENEKKIEVNLFAQKRTKTILDTVNQKLYGNVN
jgi:hypothetical protein